MNSSNMEPAEGEMEIQSRFEAGLEIFVMSGCMTILDGAVKYRR